MNNPMLQSFLSTALPIVIAVLLGTWANNKRLDDFAKRLDGFARRLDRIEGLLDDIRKELVSQGERITRLELVR
jgi:hypothetical protein